MTRSRRRRIAAEPEPAAPATTIFQGGRYQPLTTTECDRIVDCAFDILAKIGMGETPGWLADQLCEQIYTLVFEVQGICVEVGARAVVGSNRIEREQ